MQFLKERVYYLKYIITKPLTQNNYMQALSLQNFIFKVDIN